MTSYLEFIQRVDLSPINIGVQLTAIALPCLLLSESAHSLLGRSIFKPLATLGFLIAALAYIPTNAATGPASPTAALTSVSSLAEIPGAMLRLDPSRIRAYIGELTHVLCTVAPSIASVSHTTYTQAMMGAFVLGAVGDVFLITKKGFLPGLGSFLAGHAAFMVAFTFHGQDDHARRRAVGFIMAVAAVVGPWLLPKIKNTVMRGAVIVYMAVISAMVITAFGSITSGQAYLPERIIGVLMFFASDLFVAREEFVHKSVLNMWIGLPLYYAAQILLASTLRGQHVLN
ncbi:YhhN-like protein-domain-containing protein [Powellomyces hirtus]|nr:YhhN-like protein-domain-containing protein [Powellomyces hirtus]KAI8910594.1 YhhN-like protein-domain-containing protein [Powellomyces hirtus]